ncbi:TPA: hypothetical protein ACH3X3_008733 [Trebouxia sp. C0006]
MGCKKHVVPSPSGSAELELDSKLDSNSSSFSDLNPVKQEKGEPCPDNFVANALSCGFPTSG